MSPSDRASFLADLADAAPVREGRHPATFAPATLILIIALSVFGAVIGVQLILHLGITPNTSIIGALVAMLLARVPLGIFAFTSQPKLGNGCGALERWPHKQALTIGRGAGTEQRGEVGPSPGVVERIADRNVGKRHPPRHQEVTTLQPLLEELCPH